MGHGRADGIDMMALLLLLSLAASEGISHQAVFFLPDSRKSTSDPL